MPRYKLTIEYDGTAFMGWQRQCDGIPTVQQSIEDAIYRFAQEEVSLYCAGRTDAGVHAYGQVAHFDMSADRESFSVMQGLNYHLGDRPISIVAVERVGSEFHARFNAVRRSYLYRIICRRSRLAVDYKRAWQLRYSLDVEAMSAAASVLIGRHDFSSFRDSQCQAKSPVKTLDRLEVREYDSPYLFGREIVIYAEAKSFLHHQVRNIVGSLVNVGRGKWSVEELQEVLEAKDRRAGGPTAPAHGLYFVRADYDDHHSREAC